MKNVLLTTTLILITGVIAAQRNDSLYFNITIDSCTKEKTVLNREAKQFWIAVKGSSGVYTLFKKDKIEIGIKVYVNKIIEDGRSIMIARHVFIEKDKDEWKELSNSGYHPVETPGNLMSIKIGSNTDEPDFFIQYSIRKLDKKPGESHEGILNLIPALKETFSN
ncbi:MAG: hypothetical protein JNK27_03195 [Chitinophagaceae bacterium]|nr:hypothetical protein [Chitinophagaceae bacterium]